MKPIYETIEYNGTRIHKYKNIYAVDSNHKNMEDVSEFVKIKMRNKQLLREQERYEQGKHTPANEDKSG